MTSANERCVCIPDGGVAGNALQLFLSCIIRWQISSENIRWERKIHMSVIPQKANQSRAMAKQVQGERSRIGVRDNFAHLGTTKPNNPKTSNRNEQDRK